jgi:hypothetical protein
LKQKRKLRKLWQESRDPACKTVLNWVSQNIRRIVRKRALERWGKTGKLQSHTSRPQTVWPIAKSLTKRGGPKAPSAIHGPLGSIFYPIDKANIIADCLKKPAQSTRLV